MLNGLTTVNVEISSFCQKHCYHCHRRVVEKEYPKIKESYGFMPLALINKIAKQLPNGIVVQLHSSGEPLMYPDLKDAILLFSNQLTNIVTNGKWLMERFDQIVGGLDTLCVSVFEGDPEQEEQFKIIKKFVKKKGSRKPLVVIKLEGELDNLLAERYRDLGLVTTRKIFKEGKKEGTVIYNLVYPMIPEHGICQDLLSHLCIDSNGLVYACVRFDPEKKGLLGDVKKDYIDDIWNSEKRKKMLYLHERGLRNKIPLCKGCEYYGIPVEAR